MFRIRIICHADPDLAPDLGSQKCPYGSPDTDPDSYFFIQIRYPDPERVKVAKDNLYRHIFMRIRTDPDPKHFNMVSVECQLF